MNMTKEQVRKEMEKRLKESQNDPHFKISEEQLENWKEAMMDEANLQILSLIMSTPDRSKNTLRETQTITVEVLQETAESLNKVFDRTGISIGEQIDRMTFQFHPSDIGVAVQFTCEDLLAHTIKFNEMQFQMTVYLLVSLLKKGLFAENNTNLRKTLEELCDYLKQKITEPKS